MDQAERLRNVVKARNQRLVPNARVITVTSGKGGVGKSNLAVNLAVWFRKMGKRVIIFDADFGLANVEVMFGTVPPYNLSDLIYGDKEIREIICKGPMDIGFISGGSGIVSLNNLKQDQIAYLIHSLTMLNDLCDVLIVDTGAGISDTVLEFVLASPEVLLVTTPEPSSITDSYSVMKALYKNEKFIKDGTNIHLASKRIGLRTDASSKIEKGLDPNLALEAINRACQLVEELGCGEVVEGVIDIYPNPVEPWQLPFEPEKMNRLLGMNVPEDLMLEYFNRLGLTIIRRAIS